MRRMIVAMAMGAVTLSILAFVVAGWSWRASCQSKVPETDSAEASPFRLTPSKTQVWAGEEITIMIESRQPGSIERGIDAYLECWDGENWVTKYTLITPLENDRGPYVYPYPAGVPIEDIALLGPGPDIIRLPGNLKPGWYRIRKRFSLVLGNGEYVSQTAYARLRIVP